MMEEAPKTPAEPLPTIPTGQAAPPPPPRPAAPCLLFHFLLGSRAGSAERVESEVITLGRRPSNDIALSPSQDVNVSGNHARIVHGSDGWWLEDLDSTNGTLHNDTPVNTRARLQSGDRISLGRHSAASSAEGTIEFRVEMPGQSHSSPPPSAPQSAAPAPPTALGYAPPPPGFAPPPPPPMDSGFQKPRGWLARRQAKKELQQRLAQLEAQLPAQRPACDRAVSELARSMWGTADIHFPDSATVKQLRQSEDSQRAQALRIDEIAGEIRRAKEELAAKLQEIESRAQPKRSQLDAANAAACIAKEVWDAAKATLADSCNDEFDGLEALGVQISELSQSRSELPGDLAERFRALAEQLEERSSSLRESAPKLAEPLQASIDRRADWDQAQQARSEAAASLEEEETRAASLRRDAETKERELLARQTEIQRQNIEAEASRIPSYLALGYEILQYGLPEASRFPEYPGAYQAYQTLKQLEAEIVRTRDHLSQLSSS